MAGYIGTTPVPQATQHRESFTATGGQTSFATAGYTPQFIDVYLNGVKLAPADYTATNGSDVVLASGATASDILEIVAYTPFEVANQTFTGTTTAANLTVTGAFTSQGIDDNADAVAITIDSSENVGIGTSSPTTKLQSKSGSISTPTNNVGLIANASASFVVDHGNDYGIYTGYVNSTNDAIGIAATRTLGSALPLSLQPFGGNVGIGDTNPYAWSSVQPSLNLRGTSASFPNRSGALIFKSQAGTHMTVMDFETGNDLRWYQSSNSGSSWDERMRIDSSGHLLVGKSTSAFGTQGIELQNDGELIATKNGTPIYVNRITTDGAMQNFYKDGTAVGSIGTNAGYLKISSGNTSFGSGIEFHNLKALPVGANGASSNGTVDLGESDRRWKDLHLSGSIEIENGTGNVGVGKNALRVNTNSYNTAVGMNACYTNSSGKRNTSLGYDALYTNSSGHYNVAIGMQALLSNTASNNTAVGYQAGYSNATGVLNTFLGKDAGYYVTGSKNTIVGAFHGNQHGLDIRTSDNNIVLSDGDGNPRGRFDANGKFYVKTGNDQGIEVRIGSTTATNGKAIDFIDGDDNNCGTIRINASANTVTYNTSSDHRLKENVVELTGATTRLKQLEPKRFNFISDPDDITVDGFLAHEVQTVVPEAITGTHNEVGEDSNPVYQQIDQSKLVPLLVATIKELEARITALENA